MDEIMCNETHKRHIYVKFLLFVALSFFALSFLLLVSFASAAPFAYVTNADSNTVSVIDTATNKIASTITVGTSPNSIVASPDGKRVYVSNEGSNTTSVIDTATNKVISTISGFTKPFDIAVSSDGAKLYVLNRGYYETHSYENGSTEIVFIAKNASIVDTATNKIISSINVGSNPIGFALTPDGKKLYVPYGFYDYTSGNNVGIIDTATKKNIGGARINGVPVKIAMCPNGKKVFVTSTSQEYVWWAVTKWQTKGVLTTIDTNTNNITATLTVIPLNTIANNVKPYGVASSPDGTKIYVSSNEAGTLAAIDAASNTITTKITIGSFPNGLIVSQDGKRLYATGGNNVSVIDATTNTVITSIPVGNNPKNIAISYASVTPTKPVSNFTSNVTKGYIPLTVNFTDKSTGTPTSWHWDFGDKTNSTAQNPTHKYSAAGKYNVSLKVTNSAGSNTTIKYNYIVASVKPPVANFTSNVTKGYIPLTVNFTDKSTGTPTSWYWNFGDKTNSTAQSPTHKYSAAGKYNVSLKVTNSAGSNTTIKYSYIVASIRPPVANFTATPITGKVPLNVTFTDKSTNNPTSWYWVFGDNGNSTAKNPVHKYLVKGNYTVSLIVKNAGGNSSITKAKFISVT